jgi:uncharacterized protein YcnI
MNKATTIKASIALSAGALLALAVPLAASAHVTITPYSAEPGSYSLITLKVPNESGTASTVKVELDLPKDTPFTSVSYVPVAGWTAELVTETLPKPVKIDNNTLTEAVTKIIWTADAGSGIQDGQLQLFPISVGAVPDTGKIVLTAIQTYSDGTIANWNETGADAEDPAPVLYVNDAPVASHDADAEVTTQTIEESDHASSASSSDTVARVLGIGGLVVGAIGVVLAIVTMRRRAQAYSWVTV